MHFRRVDEVGLEGMQGLGGATDIWEEAVCIVHKCLILLSMICWVAD